MSNYTTVVQVTGKQCKYKHHDRSASGLAASAAHREDRYVNSPIHSNFKQNKHEQIFIGNKNNSLLVSNVLKVTGRWNQSDSIATVTNGQISENQLIVHRANIKRLFEMDFLVNDNDNYRSPIRCSVHLINDMNNGFSWSMAVRLSSRCPLCRQLELE